jgi:hypothetical protein
MQVAFLPTFRRDCLGFTAFAVYALGISAPTFMFHQPFISLFKTCGKKRWLWCMFGMCQPATLGVPACLRDAVLRTL